MFEKGGYFRPKDNQIKVASNQSFLDVLFCLLHEYAHYLQKDEKISVPKTVGEYVFDAEECTCNYVAYSVLCRYFKEHEDSINKIVKKYCVPGASCDAEYAYELVNQIITHLEDKLQSCDFEDVLFVPRGLIHLSTEDNAALYRLIMEEISPIIPEEAEEEWSI